MNPWITLRISGILFASTLMVSCGQRQAPNAKAGSNPTAAPESKQHEDEADHAEGVSYHEGTGLTLSSETTNALGLETTQATWHELNFTISLNAQVYRGADENSSRSGGEKNGFAYATVMLSKREAETLKRGTRVIFEPAPGSEQSVEGILWKLDQTQASITDKVEALIEIPDPTHRLPIGIFLKGQAHPEKTLKKIIGVPHSSVLDTVQGKFVYVVKEESYLRTPIKTGNSDLTVIEITEGLQVGETVVVTPVEKLWLIELRLTKGGGHSD